MSPRAKTLREAGAALYGEVWHKQLAVALGPRHPLGPRAAIDLRLMRRWASGARYVPDWVGPELHRLLMRHGIEPTPTFEQLKDWGGMMRIDNDGPEIVSTDYFETPNARAGALFLSVNAGVFRLLVPPRLEYALCEMKTGREAIISRGPWPEMGRDDALELMFEDGTDNPFALHFGVEQIDRMPLREDEGRSGLICTVWTTGPTRRLILPARYRRALTLPYMRR
ncbi:hypothetical protein [Rhodomicrobium udaipurense]|uniref:Uncharacterized protein n=1 Tax=Rhodomicrobium udaipurense TaxID=1202716 RepID=A0A8I1GG65_9HYPH|nr:hypothetical protein [Rhodomicrobium udaipurense]MBJ7543286.1 hypothetical protein [Rhodomicrobium udaipurense]